MKGPKEERHLTDVVVSRLAGDWRGAVSHHPVNQDVLRSAGAEPPVGMVDGNKSAAGSGEDWVLPGLWKGRSHYLSSILNSRMFYIDII